MHLAIDFDAVCIQLTDIIDTAVIAQLCKSGINLSLLEVRDNYLKIRQSLNASYEIRTIDTIDIS